MAEVGRRLKEYFDYQGITQAEIAKRLRVSTAYINSLFTGKRAFGKKQAELWMRQFGLSSSWLLTGEGEMFTRNNVTVYGDGNAVGDSSKVTNTTNNNFGSCSAENSRADATLNKVLDMLVASQARIDEIQKQLTDHNATSVRLLDLLQEKDALILRLTNKLLDK